jgi:predicted MFS family arabinose efflux permease
MIEAPYTIDDSQAKGNGFRLLLQPLKNKQFIGAISVTLIWTFSTAIVGSYYSIYLLEDVQMSYSLISLVSMIAVPLNLLITPVWTKFLQRKPWHKGILLAQLICISAYILNPVVTASRPWFYVFCIGLGTVASPGLSLAHTHLTYAYMPEENRTSYISFNAVLGQIFAFLGTNVGVLFIQFSQKMSVNVLGLQMGNKQMINWISAALMLILCAYTQISVRRKLPE